MKGDTYESSLKHVTYHALIKST